MKLSDVEKNVMNNIDNMTDADFDIYDNVLRRIEREEKCKRCGQPLVDCAFGQFICNECGEITNFWDYVEE